MPQYATVSHPAKVVFPFFFAVIALMSCGKEAIDIFDCSGATPTYTGEIKPVLDASCGLSGCHDAASAEGGIILTDYPSAAAISRNDSFLGSIQHKRGYRQMPEDAAKLSPESIQLLTCWVQGGSPE
jgi:hypothetical protein